METGALPVHTDLANFQRHSVHLHCRSYSTQESPVRPLHMCRITRKWNFMVRQVLFDDWNVCEE